MNDQSRIRELLLEQLSGQNAHVDFDRAVEGLTFDELCIRSNNFPHSIWELTEHIRIAQQDIVDFCINSEYEQPPWPEGYWPESHKPRNMNQWEATLGRIRKDHQTMVNLVTDHNNDLLAPIPHGDGQTLFREAMLIVDHNAYHIGQIVQLRRAMGIW